MNSSIVLHRLISGLSLLFWMAACTEMVRDPASTTDVIPSPTAPMTPARTKQVSAKPPLETAQPQPDNGFHGPATRTGIEDVDRVIEAFLSGDQGQMRQVLSMTRAECTHAEGLGGPPKCAPEETEGQEVEVFPFLGSEGHFMRRNELEEWGGVQIGGLYAVYRISQQVFSEPYYPAGEYGILFIGTGRHPAAVVRVEQRGVVRIDALLGQSPQEVLDREAEEIILPPP